MVRGGKKLKLLLQDETTVIGQVSKVQEQIHIKENQILTKLEIQIEMVDGVDGDKIVGYYQEIGMNHITIISNQNEIIHTYTSYPILTTIYATYTEESKWINFILEPRKVEENEEKEGRED